MLKRWLVAGVAALVIALTFADSASAQWRRGRDGFGVSVGWGGYYPGWGYSNYRGYPAYGYGWSGYYPGYYRGYYPSYGYMYPRYSYSYPGYYTTYPSYYSTGSVPIFGRYDSYTTEATTLAPASSTSAYTPQGDAVILNVRVSDPNAEVIIDGHPTQQRGMERQFISPPLETGNNYSYEVRARWTDAGGTPHEMTRNVAVSPGQAATVDFTTDRNADRSTEVLSEQPRRMPPPEQQKPRNPDNR